MSINVIVELNVKPEKFAESEEYFKHALKATREWEGCTSVDVFASKAESRLFFLTVFDTEEQYGEYITWRQQENGAILEELLSEPLKLTITEAKDFGCGSSYFYALAKSPKICYRI